MSSCWPHHVPLIIAVCWRAPVLFLRGLGWEAEEGHILAADHHEVQQYGDFSSVQLQQIQQQQATTTSINTNTLPRLFVDDGRRPTGRTRVTSWKELPRFENFFVNLKTVATVIVIKDRRQIVLQSDGAPWWQGSRVDNPIHVAA